MTTITCTSARKNGQKKVLIPPHLLVDFSDPSQRSHYEKGELGEHLLCAYELCLNTLLDHIPDEPFSLQPVERVHQCFFLYLYRFSQDVPIHYETAS